MPGWGTPTVTAWENPSSQRGSSWQRTGQKSLEPHEAATAAWSRLPRTWLTATTTKAGVHHCRTGRRPCPHCGQRGWSRSSTIGSAAGLMVPLVGAWRETPLFRHWRKPRQLSLATGWRERYRWFRWPVAYSKARTIAGLRCTQTEPTRKTERSGRPAIDDSRPLRMEGPRGYRETLTLPRGPGPWPTPPAGTATAAPTPALTAVRAPRESWPTPSTPTFAAGTRNFPQNNRHFHGD